MSSINQSVLNAYKQAIAPFQKISPKKGSELYPSILNTPLTYCIQSLLGFTLLLRGSRNPKSALGLTSMGLGITFIGDLLLNHKLLNQATGVFMKAQGSFKEKTNELQVEDAITINRNKSDTLKHALDWHNWEHLHKNCEITEITNEGHVYFVLKNISQKDLSCSLEINQFNDRISWNALPGSRSRLSGWVRVIDTEQPNQSKLLVRLTFHRSDDLMEYTMLLLQKDKIRNLLRDSLLQMKENIEAKKKKIDQEDEQTISDEGHFAITPEQLPVMEEDDNSSESGRLLH